ncbi:MAG: AAA family ATPase [Deltaproteobacteria bacterium]|nr:AAA family ATPase [Deltaproteobacteria bacterium]
MTSARYFYFASFCLDRIGEQLWHRTQLLPVRRKPLAVLRYLVEHAGEMVTKEALLDAVWPSVQVSEGVLTVDIREVRKVLGDDARVPRFIETVHGRGYRFIGKVVSSQYPVASGRNSAASHQQLTTDNWQLITHLVGRETELAQLHRWLEKALHGERQIVFVTGEPGIGKTTVVEAFLESLAPGVQGLTSEHVQGSRFKGQHIFLSTQHSALSTCDSSPQPLTPSLWIGRGQCIEQYGAGEAYMPVLEALGRLGREPSGRRLVALLRQHAPLWLTQLPALLTAAEREQLQREVQGATRERMLRELAEALAALTAEHPLVLVLEDLHWSDVSTLELLSVLARRQDPMRLLVIGTYRPVEMLGTGHPLRAVKQELHLHQQCEEQRLGFLTEAHVAEYLTVRLGVGAVREPSRQKLACGIHRRTDGNPLFMVNVVNYLLAQGELPESLERIQVEVPESIQQMIENQIDRLSPEEQRRLEVASIVGADFSAAAVAAGLETATGEVEGYCTGFVRREQFLRANGVSEWPDGTVAARYSFLHALYQEVLYQRVPAGQRMALHRGIGERLERAYSNRTQEIAAELAVHFARGREYGKAIQYLHQAGENAIRRSAHREAILHLTKGLELLKTLPNTPERTQQELTLQIALGASLITTKGYAAPEVESTYSRARELCQQVGETSQLFPALRGLWVFYLVQAKLHTARELGEQLLSLAQRAHDSALLLETHRPLGTTLFHLGELTPARAHLEQGIALYNPQQHRSHAFLYGQDPGVISRSYAIFALWFLGYPDQAWQRLHETLTLAKELSHPFSLALALFFAAVAYQLRREGQRVQEQAEEAITLCTGHEFPFWLAKGTILRGWALAEQGQGEEGIVQIRQGLAAYRAIGSELWRPYYLALLAEAYGKVEQPKEGLRVLAEALDAVDKTGERFYAAELYRLKGTLTLKQSEVRGPQSGVPNTQHPTPSTHAEAEAEAYFVKAIDIARYQKAKSLELRATVSLSRLWQQQGKKAEARQVLAEIYGWFTEGFDTRDLKGAKALLEELTWPHEV